MISFILKIALRVRKQPGHCSLRQIRDLQIKKGSICHGTHMLIEVNVFSAIFSLHNVFLCLFPWHPRSQSVVTVFSYPGWPHVLINPRWHLLSQPDYWKYLLSPSGVWTIKDKGTLFIITLLFQEGGDAEIHRSYGTCSESLGQQEAKTRSEPSSLSPLPHSHLLGNENESWPNQTFLL